MQLLGASLSYRCDMWDRLRDISEFSPNDPQKLWIKPRIPASVEIERVMRLHRRRLLVWEVFYFVGLTAFGMLAVYLTLEAMSLAG